ncbi:MAG: nucleotide 5'-monophosphate nucleosidase PpnN [Mariprofundus sp.]|nr:nucleotide 5'-monophosphate nucleosidase PpnN [Mariprofundus sp.]
MNDNIAKTVLTPSKQLGLLSKAEVGTILNTSSSAMRDIFRSCALAVLNCDADIDDGHVLLQRHQDFEIHVRQVKRGMKLELINAPASAFVDGEIIQGIHEHLFAVLRDIVFAYDTVLHNPNMDMTTPDGITNAVFHLLRNANVLRLSKKTRLVVCWGGHSITRHEYDYSKEVGYQIGLRDMDICTGCGPGAMKGPMKGATIGHAKQRINDGLYLGITEPGIIAAESPNPIVNNLVILPDIEKRLEAFVRTGHGIVVFAGGVGTAEEILYLLGILMQPENKDIPFPFIMTGPESSRPYFEQINTFIAETLGIEAQQKYQVIIDDPALVAQRMKEGIAQVRQYRKEIGDAYYFNWNLAIDTAFQQPFAPSHENVRNLQLHKNQPPYMLAANLRRVFSALVAGNVKDEGIRAIEEFGDFEIYGDAAIMDPVDALLTSFVAQNRMKIAAESYRPCYKVMRDAEPT